MNLGGGKKGEWLSVDWIWRALQVSGSVAGEVSVDEVLFPVVGVVRICCPELALFMVENEVVDELHNFVSVFRNGFAEVFFIHGWHGIISFAVIVSWLVVAVKRMSSPSNLTISPWRSWHLYRFRNCS